MVGPKRVEDKKPYELKIVVACLLPPVTLLSVGAAVV
jgi:hypothetical protein